MSEINDIFLVTNQDIKEKEKEVNDENFIEELILSIHEARKVKSTTDMLIPEEIAINLEVTLNQLEEKMGEFITNAETEEEIKKSNTLQKEWALYREKLKIKFALAGNQSQTMNELKNGWGLGIEDKSFPDVGLYLGNSVVEDQVLEIIRQQTLLARERLRLVAEDAGKVIMTDQESLDLQNAVEELE